MEPNVVVGADGRVEGSSNGGRAGEERRASDGGVCAGDGVEGSAATAGVSHIGNGGGGGIDDGGVVDDFT